MDRKVNPWGGDFFLLLAAKCIPIDTLSFPLTVFLHQIIEWEKLLRFQPSVENMEKNCVLSLLAAGIAGSHLMQLSKGSSLLYKDCENADFVKPLHFYHVSLVKTICHPFTLIQRKHTVDEFS